MISDAVRSPGASLALKRGLYPRRNRRWEIPHEPAFTRERWHHSRAQTRGAGGCVWSSAGIAHAELSGCLRGPGRCASRATGAGCSWDSGLPGVESGPYLWPRVFERTSESRTQALSRTGVGTGSCPGSRLGRTGRGPEDGVGCQLSWQHQETPGGAWRDTCLRRTSRGRHPPSPGRTCGGTGRRTAGR